MISIREAFPSILAIACSRLPPLEDLAKQRTFSKPSSSKPSTTREPMNPFAPVTSTGSFFSTPRYLLPAAEATKNLELRTNALAKNILVDENGKAAGVAYIDRHTRQEVEVYGRAVVVAASCVESARIMLNSKSRQWPAGIANSSGQLGRNLCDHLYGESARGYLPQLLGQPSFPDHVGDSTIAWMPRWQNLKDPAEEKFIRGYSVYPDGGCSQFPYYWSRLEGYGVSYKRDIDDLRESPSLTIIELLQKRGAQVEYNDPYFPSVGQGRKYALNMTSTPLEKIPEFDCVVIVTDHSQYDYASIVDKAKLVVDTRNATKGIDAPNIVNC